MTIYLVFNVSQDLYVKCGKHSILKFILIFIFSLEYTVKTHLSKGS